MHFFSYAIEILPERRAGRAWCAPEPSWRRHQSWCSPSRPLRVIFTKGFPRPCPEAGCCHHKLRATLHAEDTWLRCSWPLFLTSPRPQEAFSTTQPARAAVALGAAAEPAQPIKNQSHKPLPNWIPQVPSWFWLGAAGLVLPRGCKGAGTQPAALRASVSLSIHRRSCSHLSKGLRHLGCNTGSSLEWGNSKMKFPSLGKLGARHLG